jgi:hypothetical protein
MSLQDHEQSFANDMALAEGISAQGQAKLYAERLTGIFETLRGRYPKITTIENGLEEVFAEREKLHAEIREIAGELEETARLPELTDGEKRTWRAVKNRLLSLVK